MPEIGARYVAPHYAGDAAHDEIDRMRADCDSYVDAKLAALEDTLTKTLRTVGRGRTSLRSGAVADYRD